MSPLRSISGLTRREALAAGTALGATIALGLHRSPKPQPKEL